MLRELFALLRELFALLFQYFVSLHDSRVTVFNRLVEFVFHIHVLSHFRVGGSGSELVQHIHHVVVVGIFVLVNLQHLLCVALNISLVEHTQHLLQTVVDIALQTRYLHNDAVVRKTFYKRLGIALGNDVAVIVEDVVVYVYYRLLDIAHFMAKQIDSHHRIGISFFVSLAYIVLVVVLCAKILAESQRLGVEPSLLQLNQHDAVFNLIAFLLAHGSREVNTEHRQRVACSVAIFMWPHSDMNHFFLQQCRQNGFGNTLVLHDIFEYGVVNRIGYMYYHIRTCLLLYLQIYDLFN